jgi:hypothetical protein
MSKPRQSQIVVKWSAEGCLQAWEASRAIAQRTGKLEVVDTKAKIAGTPRYGAVVQPYSMPMPEAKEISGMTDSRHAAAGGLMSAPVLRTEKATVNRRLSHVEDLALLPGYTPDKRTNGVTG